MTSTLVGNPVLLLPSSGPNDWRVCEFKKVVNTPNGSSVAPLLLPQLRLQWGS